MSFTLAHLSDTHLSYEAYAHLTQGRNTRGRDVVRSLDAVVKDIVASDPPLVIHSGDVFDRPHPQTSYILAVQAQLQKLASLRPDGTRRQVIVIAGNHDLPRSPLDPCMLDVYRGIPGLRVVSRGYRRIDFDDEAALATSATGSSDIPAELKGVVIHALPHDDLKSVDFNDITPTAGKVNILTSHGVATGSDLFLRSLGREYPIPAELLTLPWEYVALGHWHKRGPVSVTAATSSRSRIWYAGSPENISFRDLRDNDTARGYLQVTINPGQMPDVTCVDLPVRAMFRLPTVDASAMEPDELTAALKEALTKREISGAVVGQIVEGISREKFALVDLSGVRKAAASALHYELTVRYATLDTVDDQVESRGLGELAAILNEQAELLFALPRDRQAALEMARELLGDVLATPTPDNLDTADPSPASRSAADGADGAERPAEQHGDHEDHEDHEEHDIVELDPESATALFEQARQASLAAREEGAA